ncbi:hypothetical protein ACFSL6_08715 [Paenibacillus thailandensis]|uniref:Type II secretion system protein GspF domain-containing protein n=1 Tax=Paenibacillus thailandensis TaxID=393250 RepID=A0ABW5QTI7_9BACL
MAAWIETGINAAAIAGQYLFAFLAFYLLLRLKPERKPRWLHLTLGRMKRREMPDRWMKLAGIDRSHPAFAEREALLAGCGVTADAAWYVFARKLMLGVLFAALVLAVLARVASVLAGNAWTFCIIVIGTLIVLLFGDLPLLRYVRRLRAHQITKEIYVISNQLLYLADSSLHIHTKLMRCLPFARTMRGDLEKLLAEWYHDAGSALRTFKQKLGTDEGMSFVETIDALRQHESREYYELLRERIQDYKEKLELEKESRKESGSYVLFVLAGIPIMYTFQVFIYPWVREGQKLFDSLG